MTDSGDDFLREVAAISEPVASEIPVGLRAGEIIADRFRIERRAGRGGMGAVYEARDLSTDVRVAIKVTAKQSKSVTERFFREAVMLAELSHPRIVRYVAHGTTSEGLPFLAMDWLDGEDLSDRLARSGLAPEEALVLVRHAAEGLGFAHARGIVHRDVKPSNLLLVGGDHAAVKVIDFGVARRGTGAGTLTRPGMALGTVGYMAPEQAAEVADVDARADVYGLGCVLFECLTGRAPFVGRPAMILAKVIAEAAPRPSAFRPELSDEIDRLLGRLLAKSRDDRPRDAADLIGVIDGIRSLFR